MSSEGVPEGRCGFVLEPTDVPGKVPEEYNAKKDEWYRFSNAACCRREVWDGGDTDRCIWHAETDEKPAEALVEARTGREEHLHGANLPAVDLGDKMDFDDCYLWGASFEGTKLENVTFDRTRGRYLHFIGAELRNTTFRGSVLRGTHFDETYLPNVQFLDADLQHAQFQSTFLPGARFLESDLRRSRFLKSGLGGAEFTESKLGDSTFTNTDLRQAEFSDSIATAAEFVDVDFEDAHFSKMKIENTLCRESDLLHAAFTDSNAKESRFTDCEIKGSQFSRVLISDATFSDVDIREAEFKNVDLSGTEFSDVLPWDVRFNDSDLRGSDFSDTDLRRAQFITSDLEGADLSDTNLQGAGFDGSNLEHADLTNAELFHADFRNTTIFGTALDSVSISRQTRFGGHYVSSGIDSRSPFRLGYWLTIARNSWYELQFAIAPSYFDSDEEDKLNKAAWSFRKVEQLSEEAGLSKQARLYNNKRKDAKRMLYLVENGGSRLRWGKALLSSLTMRYGESPRRVVGCSLIAIIAAATGYMWQGLRLTGGEKSMLIGGGAGNVPLPTLIGKSIYFSTITFTTVGYGDIQPVGWSQTIATAESFLGALLMALLVYVLGRRATW